MTSFEIPLDLPHVKILSTKILDDGDFLVSVESTKKFTKCPHCNQRSDQFVTFDEPIRLRHLDILNHRCFIEIRPKRFRCSHCKGGKTKRVITQQLSWYKPRRTMTKAFENWSLFQLVNSTITDTAVKLRCSENVLHRLVKHEISCAPDWKSFESLGVLGLDEIALRKGHKHYVTIISSRLGQELRVLTVLADRKKDTVLDFLNSIPVHLKETIEAACVDMYDAFTLAIKEALPAVEVVVDRFHVAKLLGKSVDDLRKRELRRLKTELPEEDYKELKGSMWPCRSLSAIEGENQALTKLLSFSPDLKQARELRIELTEIFNNVDNEHGGRVALGKWRAKVQRSDLNCFDSFLGTLKKWKREIGNHFVNFDSSGFVEGLNNKIMVLKRRCFGLGSAPSLLRRLKIDMEGYAFFGFATNHI